MKTKSKIVKSSFTKEWDNPKGGIIYFHDLELEDGTKGQIGSKTKEPDFLNVGKEIEVEVTEGKYGNKLKRVVENNFSGGGKTKVRTFAETKRMCKGTAVKAAATLNKACGEIRIDEQGCNLIANFVIGDIRGDIPKWESPQGEDMISRQTAIHAAADEYEAHQITSAEKLIEVAEVKYKYIIS